ncbi:putative Homeobox domain-containing protein [Rosa chinensis]|uniref:Putative Homeobox domain-containing protein n=1 Tax=Rosa chinensis TaxID=74649 RepID=A0A2P6S9A0_ROSCH|nr:putative Homeobox domain-containing protein [Rosa chinensis]
MARAPCCDKANVKKGQWSPEEDKAKSWDSWNWWQLDSSATKSWLLDSSTRIKLTTLRVIRTRGFLIKKPSCRNCRKSPLNLELCFFHDLASE